MAIHRVGLTRKHRTVSEAYYMADANDILLIDEGVYREQISMTTNKPVHLVGNTYNPGLGKVIIDPPHEADSRCLMFQDFSGPKTVYIEGINLKFPVVGTSEPVAAWRCYDTDLVFNKCIINATDQHEYVFDLDVDGLKSISLDNCKVIWKDDYIYTGTRARHFERSGRDVEYKISKCIFSNSIDNLNTTYFTYPTARDTSAITIANTPHTTVSGVTVTNQSDMFDNDMATSASWDGLTVNDVLTFNTDLGEGNEIDVSYFRFCVTDDRMVDSVHFYGSMDGTSWTELYVLVYGTTWYSWDLNGQGPYRYFKLDMLVGYTDWLLISDYQINPEKGYIPFDYTLKPDLLGYGPHFGEYQIHTLTDYYLKGSVYDSLSETTVNDTVTLDPYNGSSKIELSGGDLSTKLATTYASQHKAIKTTTGKKTGKWYFEFRSYDYQDHTNCRVGFGTASASNDYACGGADSKSWGMELNSGTFYYGEEQLSQGPIALQTSIVGVALDTSNGKAWFSVNGVWVLDGHPSTGINPVFTFSNAKLFPMISLHTIGILDVYVDIIFNPFDLNYDIPEGFAYFSDPVKWKINYYSTATNEHIGYVYTDADSNYYINTSYSGSHFLICEDADSSPAYNDLIYSNLIPKEYI